MRKSMDKGKGGRGSPGPTQGHFFN